MKFRTVRVHAGGGFDKVVLESTQDRCPGPGEVSVRIHASSLNNHDLGVVSGKRGLHEPIIPMADGAGEVVAVGECVTEFDVGDRVVSTFYPDWPDGEPDFQGFPTTPGDGIDGFACEQVTRPVRAFTHAPKGYSHAEAATVPTAGVTAWRALFAEGGLQPGQTVLVQGTGGLSIFALQFAKAAGASVIATSSSDAKLARMTELGADHVINYRNNPDWGMAVRAATGGRGVDQIIDVGGPGTLTQSMIAARVGGHISLIGLFTGPAGEVPLALALARQLRLRPMLVGSRRHQLDTIRALETTGIRPIICRTFALEQIVDAFEFQATGQHFGKICLEF